jgi:hypothetical protein
MAGHLDLTPSGLARRQRFVPLHLPLHDNTARTPQGQRGTFFVLMTKLGRRGLIT